MLWLGTPWRQLVTLLAMLASAVLAHQHGATYGFIPVGVILVLCAFPEFTSVLDPATPRRTLARKSWDFRPVLWVLWAVFVGGMQVDLNSARGLIALAVIAGLSAPIVWGAVLVAPFLSLHEVVVWRGIEVESRFLLGTTWGRLDWRLLWRPDGEAALIAFRSQERLEIFALPSRAVERPARLPQGTFLLAGSYPMLLRLSPREDRPMLEAIHARHSGPGRTGDTPEVYRGQVAAFFDGLLPPREGEVEVDGADDLAQAEIAVLESPEAHAVKACCGYNPRSGKVGDACCVIKPARPALELHKDG